MTHTQAIRQKAETLKEKVCRLLEWDDQQYAEFQYETGLNYLRHYIGFDPQAIDMLTRTRTYWNWWKNQWAIRDNQFIKADKPQLTTEFWIDVYCELHDARTLAAEIYPDGQALGLSYAGMIQEFFDEKEVV